MGAELPTHKPEPRKYIEKIGDRELTLEERDLHCLDDMSLWHENPRLMGRTAAGTFKSEDELEAALQATNGYANLARSIASIGQMEPVYVWKNKEMPKYLVLEGATRVTIIRDLHRKSKDPARARSPLVRAKILPPDFNERERVILLARIHVRGTSVRAWGRYIEAKFIHDNVSLENGRRALMTASEMAEYMQKSVSWVTRLWHAYEFAKKFIDHVDEPRAEKLAMDEFSTLEEISKAPEIGPKVRDYGNPDFDGLRADVFEMVKNEAFKEYRDARFMRDFHADPEKWAQLKSGEKHVATRLANDVKVNASNLKGKISTLEAQIERAIERDKDAVNEDDLEHLQRAAAIVEDILNPGVRPLRRHIVRFTKIIEEASLSDIRSVEPRELAAFETAYAYLKEQVERFGHKA